MKYELSSTSPWYLTIKKCWPQWPTILNPYQPLLTMNQPSLTNQDQSSSTIIKASFKASAQLPPASTGSFHAQLPRLSMLQCPAEWRRSTPLRRTATRGQWSEPTGQHHPGAPLGLGWMGQRLGQPLGALTTTSNSIFSLPTSWQTVAVNCSTRTVEEIWVMICWYIDTKRATNNST